MAAHYCEKCHYIKFYNRVSFKGSQITMTNDIIHVHELASSTSSSKSTI